MSGPFAAAVLKAAFATPASDGLPRLSSAGGNTAHTATPSGAGVPDRPRVLKAGVMRASVEAAEAVREAQARHEQQLQAAFDGGYAAGVADGQAAAEAQGHAAAPRLVAVLDRIADDLTVQHAAALEDSTQALLAVAFDLADWVLRTEPGAVAAASASLPQRLSEAARTLAAGPNAVVRCSHEDLAAVSGWARDGVEVLPDPRLAPGEARLDRGDGSAVLMFAAALRAAAETLGMPGER